MASGRRYDLTFFTATILEWKHLLSNDLFKHIIMDSLRFTVKENRAYLNAFVIMDNHIHLLWQIIHPNDREKVQQSFMKFTAQMIIKELRNNDPEILKQFYLGAADRKHQIWERNSLSVGVWTEDVLKQKLDYIHNNPVRAGLCTSPEDYRFSSAALYYGKPSEWDFITLCYL